MTVSTDFERVVHELLIKVSFLSPTSQDMLKKMAILEPTHPRKKQRTHCGNESCLSPENVDHVC